MMERYAAYKDSGIDWVGEIPEGWEINELKYLLVRNDGGVWGDDAPVDGGCVVLRSTDQTLNGEWAIKSPAKRDLSGVTHWQGALLEEGDLVITKSSGSDLHIGKTSLVTRAVASRNCAFSNFMQRIRTKRNLLLPRFLWYQMNSPLAREQFSCQSNTTTGLANLKGSMIGGLWISCPPLSEQLAIAGFLDTRTAKIDSLIADQEKSIALLQEYRKAVISETATKGLDPDVPMKGSGIDWIGDVPSSWKASSLSNYSYIRARLGWKGLKAEEYVENGYPMYSAFNIQEDKFVDTPANYISEERFLESPEIMLSVNDILLVKDGAGVGKCAIIRHLNESATVNGSIAVITSGKLLVGRYLYYYFESNAFQHYSRMLMGGMGVPHLFQRDIKKMKVLLPSINEQVRISDYLDERMVKIDSLISEKQQLIDKLKEYRKSLISEAVTGRFKVPGVA